MNIPTGGNPYRDDLYRSSEIGLSKTIVENLALISNGGESGIRTHGRVSPTQHFQCCTLNHSAISPEGQATGFLYYSFFLIWQVVSTNLSQNLFIRQGLEDKYWH